MDYEIERKFLVKTLPDLSGKTKQNFERYYLYRGLGIDVRIQKVNNTYEFERKSETSELGRETQKFEITKEEFEALKRNSGEAINRESYLVSENPEITIKIYHGRFKGLVRAEIEFVSTEDAEKFIPLDWMGKEITDTPLGRDSRLLDLTDKEFKDLLSK
jgi:CYTH domain-containing protein